MSREKIGPRLVITLDQLAKQMQNGHAGALLQFRQQEIPTKKISFSKDELTISHPSPHDTRTSRGHRQGVRALSL